MQGNYILKDNSANSSKGRLLWEQSRTILMNNWGLLWQQLRQRVPDNDYRSGIRVEDVDFQPTQVAIGGEAYDFVVAADGYRSKHKKRLVDGTAEFAGYVAWRGSFPFSQAEKHVDDPAYFEREKAWSTVVFPGGHALFYIIPGPDPAEDYLNWSMYTPVPPGMNLDRPATVHPGYTTKQQMSYLHKMAEDHLPQFFKTLVCNAAQDNISIHPVFDESPNRYVDDASQMILIGDAGSVLRPHTGAGAGKALQESFSLRDLVSADNTSTWTDICSSYDVKCCANGEKMVALGKYLGDTQVLNTPNWSTISRQSFSRYVDPRK